MQTKVQTCFDVQVFVSYWIDYVISAWERKEWTGCEVTALPLSFIFSLSLSSSTFLIMLVSSLFWFWSRFFSLVKALNLSCNLLHWSGLVCSQSFTTLICFCPVKWLVLQLEWFGSFLESTDGVKAKHCLCKNFQQIVKHLTALFKLFSVWVSATWCCTRPKLYVSK